MQANSRSAAYPACRNPQQVHCIVPSRADHAARPLRLPERDIMKRLILVRHGQSEMNQKPELVGGQSNEAPLTELGKQQAAALGHHFKMHLLQHAAPALIVSSTAMRARDTARILLHQLRQQDPSALEGMVVQETDEVLELSQGQWEGVPRDQCYTPETLAAIAADPWNFAAPGGESQMQVEERVTSFIVDKVTPRLQPAGPPGVVVAHGLAIKCFLRGILGSDSSITWKVRLDNTAVTEVGWVESGAAAGWHILRVNDTAHLVLDGVPH